jgi:hypothetical protein
MDNSGHFWEAPWVKRPKGKDFGEQFSNCKSVWGKEKFGVKIRSMSGNTKELFG